MSSTSSISANPWPTLWPASPKGPKSHRKKLQAKNGKVPQDADLAERVALACHSEAGAHALARDIRTLTTWISHDVLALVGPSLDIRNEIFDFIVAELGRRESVDPRRIRPVRIALQNQRDDLLAFAGVQGDKLATIARAHQLPEHVVRAACVLHRKPSTSPSYWQGWNRLRAKMGGKFHAVFDAVAQAMAQTPRSSALVENLNSRLRNYFTLRRQLGGSYLDLEGSHARLPAPSPRGTVRDSFPSHSSNSTKANFALTR